MFSIALISAPVYKHFEPLNMLVVPELDPLLLPLHQDFLPKTYIKLETVVNKTGRLLEQTWDNKKMMMF